MNPKQTLKSWSHDKPLGGTPSLGASYPHAEFHHSMVTPS
jgi:hypothetical protein